MKLPLVLLIVALATGCVRYRHEHVNLDGSREITTFGSFLYVGSAGKVRSEIKAHGTNYTRIITVGQIQGKGDTEFISAAAEGAARGAAQGMKP